MKHGKPILGPLSLTKVFPDSAVGKEAACNAGDLGSIPGWGRSPGGGKGDPLPYCILAWRIPWTVESVGLQRVGQDLIISMKIAQEILYMNLFVIHMRL